MRTEAEIVASARDTPPFSNGTEYYEWSGNWCDNCHTPAEKAWRDFEAGKREQPLKEYPSGCPLLACAVAHSKTPIEWMEQDPFSLADRYHCIEHRGPDDGGHEPRPKPEPPNMDGLFERPERGVRLLSQPEEARAEVQ